MDGRLRARLHCPHLDGLPSSPAARRAGQKGRDRLPAAYADQFHKAETDADTGEELNRETFFMKQYTVFNAEQADGLLPHFYAVAAPSISPLEHINHAEAVFAALGADICHSGNRAYYALKPDFLQMPPSRPSRMPKPATPSSFWRRVHSRPEPASCFHP